MSAQVPAVLLSPRDDVIISPFLAHHKFLDGRGGDALEGDEEGSIPEELADRIGIVNYAIVTRAARTP